MPAVLISKNYCNPDSAYVLFKTQDFLHHSLTRSENLKQTDHILTFPIMHHFLSKQRQQTGTSNTVLLSSLVHDDVTHKFFDSEKEAFPRF